jgi:hypothetical protein
MLYINRVKTRSENCNIVIDAYCHMRTGHPLGDAGFTERPEDLLRRFLKKRKPGPKPKQKDQLSTVFTELQVLSVDRYSQGRRFQGITTGAFH